MRLRDIFPYDSDPNAVSVYVGRVIELGDNFDLDGKMYVDLEAPNSTDLERGALTSVEATASYSMRNLHRCWEAPPEIKSKSNFMGAMTATMSGDFHLQNYCFDMQTIAWFSTVSAALNALGIVNIPPVMFSMDLTPFPGKAVSINIAEALQEFINEFFDAFLREIDPEAVLDKVIEPPSLEEVQENISKLREGDLTNPEDPVTMIVWNVIEPLYNLANSVVKPYMVFIECVSLVFELVKNRTSDVYNLTFPITQFSDSASPENVIAARNTVCERIGKFKESVETEITSVFTKLGKEGFVAKFLPKLVGYIYAPVAYIYTKLKDSLDDIASVLKDKLTGVFNGYLRQPLLSLATTIAMSIQPMVASLPTIVQLAVKYAIKDLLRKLLGIPMKAMVKPLASPIKSVMENAVGTLSNEVTSILATVASSLVNPVVQEIQSLYYSIMPVKSIESIKLMLESWSTNPSDPIPLLFYVEGASAIPKTFDELDWSDPKDIASFVLTVYNTASKLASDPNELVVKKETTEVYAYLGDAQADGMGYPEVSQPLGNSLQNITGKKIPISILDGDGKYTGGNIPDGGAMKGGKIVYGGDANAILFFDEFDSKEAFMPVFERQHPAIQVDAIFGEGIYEGAVRKMWLTNGVPYIETEIEGETQRFITSGQPMSITVGTHKDEETGEEVRDTVYIERGYLYQAMFIAHIPSDANDPETGADLVPQYTLSEDGTERIPIKFMTPKTNDNGEILYKRYKDLPAFKADGSLSDNAKTFSDIAALYYRPLVQSILSREELARDLEEFINLNPGDYADLTIKNKQDRQDLFASKFAETSIYKSFAEGASSVTKGTGEDVKSWIISSPAAGPYGTWEKLSGSSYLFTICTQDMDNSVKAPGDTQIGCKAEFRFNYSTDTGSFLYDTGNPFKAYVPKKAADVSIGGIVMYTWEDVDTITDETVTFACRIPSTDGDAFATWAVTYLTSIGFDLSPDEQQANTVSMMIDILTHAIHALGQDNFDASFLTEALLGKILSSFDKVSGAAEGISQNISAFLDTVQDLFDLSSSIATIQRMSDRVSSLKSTVEPALRSTAQAASAVALQTCNMTQAATGKNFTFTSGDNYDLSTIADAKMQLPYCNEMSRGKLLDANTKVLVLASGLGKQNLYVVDVLN